LETLDAADVRVTVNRKHAEDFRMVLDLQVDKVVGADPKWILVPCNRIDLMALLDDFRMKAVGYHYVGR
jgi:hypothetical protein